jgi:AGZA family xanthine/uracil permease-like MFS transporter
MSRLDRLFAISEKGSSVRTDLLAGVTAFLTMACIIFVQPAALSGRMFGMETGMDFGAVTVATCLSAAIASASFSAGGGRLRQTAFVFTLRA